MENKEQREMKIDELLFIFKYGKVNLMNVSQDVGDLENEILRKVLRVKFC